MIRKIGRIGYRLARRLVIALIGGTLVLLGLIMFVTPGPALLVIPVGLAILSLEFAWARHWLQKLKDGVGPEGREAAMRHFNRIRTSFRASPPSEQ